MSYPKLLSTAAVAVSLVASVGYVFAQYEDMVPAAAPDAGAAAPLEILNATSPEPSYQTRAGGGTQDSIVVAQVMVHLFSR